MNTESCNASSSFAFHNILKQTFERLSGKELLTKCLKGLTQNVNESLNNLIRQRCPKTPFVAKRKLFLLWQKLLLSLTVASMIKASGIKDIGANSHFAFRKGDCIRLYSTSQKFLKSTRHGGTLIEKE